MSIGRTWLGRVCLLPLVCASVFFGCVAGPSVLAADLSASFDAANKLYEQGKFGEAVAAYEGMIRSGHVAPPLYFNLGNAHFKSGEVGRALAAYRQAERIDPRDPDLRANLQFVRSQVQGPTLLPNRWQRWLGKLALNEWTIMSSVALWLWLLLLALGQLRPAWRPSFRTVTLLSGISAVALCACLGAALRANSEPRVVVTAHDAAVRNGPLEESPAAFTVHDGAELLRLDRKDNWLQVSAGGRRVGWLKREQVVSLSPRS